MQRLESWVETKALLGDPLMPFMLVLLSITIGLSPVGFARFKPPSIFIGTASDLLVACEVGIAFDWTDIVGHPSDGLGVLASMQVAGREDDSDDQPPSIADSHARLAERRGQGST